MAANMNQITCCCFDLETTNLSADFGIVLCGVIKGSSDKKPEVYRGDSYPTWSKRRSDDSRILRDIVTALERYDIWVAHNGTRFDVPFLRTRLLRFGMPPLATRKLVDPVLLARSKLRMSFNSLDQVASHLRCNRKTDVQPDQWLRASLDGCREAMDYIVRHCVADVEVLEQVIGKLKCYSSVFNSWGSGY